MVTLEFNNVTDSVVKSYNDLKKNLSHEDYNSLISAIRSDIDEFSNGESSPDNSIERVIKGINEQYPHLSSTIRDIFGKDPNEYTTRTCGQNLNVDLIVDELCGILENKQITYIERVLYSDLSRDEKISKLSIALKDEPKVLEKLLALIPTGVIDPRQSTEKNEEQISSIRSTLSQNTDNRCAKFSMLSSKDTFYTPIDRPTNMAEFLIYFRNLVYDESIYPEFLKLMNLFAQSLIDLNTFTKRAYIFFGSHNGLKTAFGNIMSEYKDIHQRMKPTLKSNDFDDIEDFSTESGPSYKRLSGFETRASCHGRDRLCHEVLNDEWVGHPVWASEEVGFIAHKKNQYEETLFKVEEERHEYDFFLLSVEHLIVKFTEYEKSLQLSKDDGRRRNRVSSPKEPMISLNSITEKVIRRLYGIEHGNILIDAIKTNPEKVVPTILKTAKEKYQQWNSAKNEWNKAWREVEQKAYYKSLDHLGLPFKNAEKRFLNDKQLLLEYKSEKQDKLLKEHYDNYEYKYEFFDKSVLYDVKDIILCGLRSNSSTSESQKNLYCQTFEAFFDLLFEESSFTKHLDFLFCHNPAISSNSQISEDDVEAMFMKGILEEKGLGRWFSNDTELKKEFSNRQNINIFCDINIMSLFHYIQTLYERYNDVKIAETTILKDLRTKKRRPSLLAKSLKLLPMQLSDNGLELGQDDGYEWIKTTSKKFLSGNLDHQWFEESLRINFENKAYKLYTIDRVIRNILGVITTISQTPSLLQILDLLVDNMKKLTTTKLQQLTYRTKVRMLMDGVGDMFRLEIVRDSNAIYGQYIGVDDLLHAQLDKNKLEHSLYCQEYLSADATKYLDTDGLNTPYYSLDLLKREEQNIPFMNGNIYKPHLSVNINPLDYVVDIAPGSIDICSSTHITKLKSSLKSSRKTQMASLISKIAKNRKQQRARTIGTMK